MARQQLLPLALSVALPEDDAFCAGVVDFG